MREFKTNLEANWDRRDKEMKAFREEMKAERGAMNKKWGELSNKMGTLVEDIVAPSLPRIFKEYFGATSLKSFAIRYKRENQKDPSKTREFDAIGVSEKYFFVNETKSSAKPEYCKEFVDILPEIPDYFPECAGRILVPIFSSIHLPKDRVNYLTRRGVYAMEMKDDIMDLVNFDAVNSMR
jgi:hypothetical protein